jgi:H+/gluconate symporter-like permease
MGLAGILVGLGLLIWLAFRGWSVLLLAPAAALIAAAFAGEPLLAHWTQTFMGSAARFLAQFFPIFLLGALFGKLMEDSGSVSSIADFMTERLGKERAILAVVIAGAIVTYGGVSLFVALFVLAPMAQALFRAAAIPNRLMPAAIALGTSTFTMSALPGTPAIQNAIPMPFFGTTAFAAPGLGLIASAIMLAFGLWWLKRREAAARRANEGFDAAQSADSAHAFEDEVVRERATVAREFDPAELRHGHQSEAKPAIALAALPLVVVVTVNFLMSFLVLPRLDTTFLAEERWGATSLSAVAGVWAVVVALAAAILTLVLVNYRRLPALRESMDAGANASVLPALSVASLVGFGAVVAALPAFGVVRDWVLTIGGGPLVSLALATNVLAALTGSASGGLTIALDALGATYMRLAAEISIDPALMHRVAVIGAGTLDGLPHNGAVVTLLAVCGSDHRQSYFDIVMVGIVGALVALVAVIGLGTAFGSF